MKVVGFTPYDKQREWIDKIEDPQVKYVTLCVGRQVGKTLLSENLLLKWSLSKPGQVSMFLSPTYQQSRKVFEDIERAVIESNLIKSSNKSNYEMEFVNGSKILFRSAERPDNLRGLTLNYLIIDEAAFIKDDIWTEILRPMILVKGKKVLFVSTPKGKNWFYGLHLRGLSEEQPNYITISGSSFDNPYIDTQELDEAKSTLPEDIFKQEILGEFVDTGGTVFKDIELYTTIPLWSEPVQGRKYFGGLDVGRQEDYTVLTILDENGNVVYIYRDRQKSWDSIVQEVVSICNRYKASIFCEVNSIGDVIYEQVKKRYNNIHPFVTTNTSKQNIIEDLIFSLNEGRLLLPSNELYPVLTNELKSFTYTYSPKTRKVVYGAINGFHDDCVMSLAIANHSMKENKTKGVYVVM